MRTEILLMGYNEISGWEVLGEVTDFNLKRIHPSMDFIYTIDLIYFVSDVKDLYSKITTEVIRYNNEHDFILGA